MADDHARDDLAQLRALVETLQADQTTQRAEFAAYRARHERPRRRLAPPRRFLPLALVALLVILTPLATFAASPFNDLTGGVHDANIGLIYDAGITKGCVPNVSYCPTANVTREEMASFLARTAGLGANPPVVNARTAQTAGSATNAINAVNAQTATNAGHAASADTATNATNATNAATLGGYAPSALTRLAFSATGLTDTLPNTSAYTDIARVTLTVPGPAAQVVYARGSFGTLFQPSGGYIVTAIRQDGAANTTGPGLLAFPYFSNGTFGPTPYAEWAFVAAPGTHTYTLVAYASGTAGALTVGNPRLVATTHPFGNAGAAGTFDLGLDPDPRERP